MKILKTLGIVLLALVVLVLILGLIAPKEMDTERSTVIAAPPAVVFRTLNDLNTWSSWSPWKEMDPAMQVTMGDTTVGPGASFSWVGEKTGTGKLTLTASTPAERVDAETWFKGMGAARTPFLLEPAGGDTRVIWRFSSPAPYPMNAMLLFTGTKAIEKDYERGLELLKEKVERELAEAASRRYNGYEVRPVDLPERHYVAVREVIGMDQIAAQYARNLARVQQALAKNKIDMAGPPCGLYFSWDEHTGQTDVAEAIPVTQPANLGEGFAAITLPAGRALVVEYFGDYQGVEAAHIAVDQYVAATGARVGFPVVEEYVTDPGAQPDPARWLTRVYYPLL